MPNKKEEIKKINMELSKAKNAKEAAKKGDNSKAEQVLSGKTETQTKASKMRVNPNKKKRESINTEKVKINNKLSASQQGRAKSLRASKSESKENINTLKQGLSKTGDATDKRQEERDKQVQEQEALENQRAMEQERQERYFKAKEEMFAKTIEKSELDKEELDAKAETLEQDIAGTNIDPSAWFANRSVGQTVAYYLGAMFAGSQGTSAQFFSSIDAAINRDVKTQMANLKNKKTELTRLDTLSGRVALRIKDMKINSSSNKLQELKLKQVYFKMLQDNITNKASTSDAEYTDELRQAQVEANVTKAIQKIQESQDKLEEEVRVEREKMLQQQLKDNDTKLDNINKYETKEEDRKQKLADQKDLASFKSKLKGSGKGKVAKISEQRAEFTRNYERKLRTKKGTAIPLAKVESDGGDYSKYEAKFLQFKTSGDKTAFAKVLNKTIDKDSKSKENIALWKQSKKLASDATKTNMGKLYSIVGLGSKASGARIITQILAGRLRLDIIGTGSVSDYERKALIEVTDLLDRGKTLESVIFSKETDELTGEAKTVAVRTRELRFKVVAKMLTSGYLELSKNSLKKKAEIFGGTFYDIVKHKGKQYITREKSK